MKLRCDIQGLDCPHCALKLEKLIREAEGIEDAAINFTARLLVLTVPEDSDEDALVEKVQAIADAFEDGITVENRD